jgi:Plant transposon protein
LLKGSTVWTGIYTLFWIESPKSEIIIAMFWHCNIPFYELFRKNRYGVSGRSLEAKALLPITALAYGGAAHAFADCFQMSITQSCRCCKMFCSTIPHLHSKQYNRSPIATDLFAINKLYKEVHDVSGMRGSLDCITYWKNCPVGWQQSYKCKEAGLTQSYKYKEAGSTINPEEICK